MLPRKLIIEVILNGFIKNGRCTFIMRLDLMLSMSLWKEFQLFQSIKSNLIKDTYPPFWIDKVIKKYLLNYNFSSNQNQVKGTSD